MKLPVYGPHGMRPRYVSSFLAVIVAGAGLCGIGHASIVFADETCAKQANADSGTRPYADGPLSPADFRCPAPNPLPEKNGVLLSAMTYTSLHYNTRFQWQEIRPGRFQARLTSFEITTQVDRRKSWTTRPNDERLLDHEQGHLDVAELWARRIQDRFDSLISSRIISGSGSSGGQAIEDLNHQVDSRVQGLLAQEKQAQDQYDVQTHHGLSRANQSEARIAQIAALRGSSDASVIKSSGRSAARVK